MSDKRWRDLSPAVRRLIVGLGIWEAGLKVAALTDIARRPAEQIRGGKRRWVLAMVPNTAGLVPLYYFLSGRRRSSTAAGSG